MTIKAFAACFLFSIAQFAFAADTQWILQQGTLTYHVSHKLHEADGVSHEAHGKGTCHDGGCDFTITAPVKSFDSGSGERDSHMMRVTHGDQFPVVTVRAHVPESAASSGTFQADLEVEFAGQSAHYKQVPFQLVTQGKQVRITGTIPATLADFKIDPPSLLTMKVKNEIPVRVDLTWNQQ
jgi:hypothetical protein